MQYFDGKDISMSENYFLVLSLLMYCNSPSNMLLFNTFTVIHHAKKLSNICDVDKGDPGLGMLRRYSWLVQPRHILCLVYFPCYQIGNCANLCRIIFLEYYSLI